MKNNKKRINFDLSGKIFICRSLNNTLPPVDILMLLTFALVTVLINIV